MRTIHLANEKKRDAQIGFEQNRRKEPFRSVTAAGQTPVSCRLLKSTLQTAPEMLLRKIGNLEDALTRDDPEIDMEQVGRKLEDLQKIYIDETGAPAHSVTRTEHLYAIDGTEKGCRPAAASQANIAMETQPVRWTGKTFPKDQALRRFVFIRSYQLRHVNGLTFDFLFEMAKKLSDSDSMMLLGGGEKGNEPLVLSNNGTPYRAFLEGRVREDQYVLIMHLTNLELKEVSHE